MAATGGGSGSSVAQPPRSETGFYCSTSGTYFADKESLSEHYKSDFHRYNLKRKVAGLPPVTREWFDARKAQLSSVAATPNARVWYDPLTKRKFMSQATYQAHVSSKKYQDLVRASGSPAPPPIITLRQLQEQQPGAGAPPQQQQQQGRGAGPAVAAAGFTVKPPQRPNSISTDTAVASTDTSTSAGGMASASASAVGRKWHAAGGRARPYHSGRGAEDSDGDDDESGWETASASDDGDAAAASAGAHADEEGDVEPVPEDEADWVEWDVCRSLFDNHISGSLADNLRYMQRRFGFSLPEPDRLRDTEGLIKYLGAKLQYGRVPLYSAGDDASARTFRSLHGVQRHMVDINRCRMVYEDNEHEYEDFYDHSSDASSDNESDAEGDGVAGARELTAQLGTLSVATQRHVQRDTRAGGTAAADWELSLPQAGGVGAGGSSSNGRVLGSREMARYYKQRPRPADVRGSVAANTALAAHRALTVGALAGAPAARPPPAEARAQRERRRAQRQWLNLALRTNVNNNLPKNVPY